MEPGDIGPQYVFGGIQKCLTIDPNTVYRQIIFMHVKYQSEPKDQQFSPSLHKATKSVNYKKEQKH